MRCKTPSARGWLFIVFLYCIWFIVVVIVWYIHSEYGKNTFQADTLEIGNAIDDRPDVNLFLYFNWLNGAVIYFMTHREKMQNKCVHYFVNCAVIPFMNEHKADLSTSQIGGSIFERHKSYQSIYPPHQIITTHNICVGFCSGINCTLSFPSLSSLCIEKKMYLTHHHMRFSKQDTMKTTTTEIWQYLDGCLSKYYRLSYQRCVCVCVHVCFSLSVNILISTLWDCNIFCTQVLTRY